jgi:hypothetical protein
MSAGGDKGFVMFALVAVCLTGVGEEVQQALAARFSVEIPLKDALITSGESGTFVTFEDKGFHLRIGETGVVFRVEENKKIGEVVVVETGSGPVRLEQTRGRHLESGDSVYIGERRPPNPAFNGEFISWLPVLVLENDTTNVVFKVRLIVTVNLEQTNMAWKISAPFGDVWQANTNWKVYAPFDDVKQTNMTWEARPNGEELTAGSVKLVTRQGKEGPADVTLVYQTGDRPLLRAEAFGLMEYKESSDKESSGVEDPWAGKAWPVIGSVDNFSYDGVGAEEPIPSDWRDPVSGLSVCVTNDGIALLDMKGSVVRKYLVSGDIRGLVFPPGADRIAFWRKPDGSPQTGWKRLDLASEKPPELDEQWTSPPYLDLKSGTVVGPGGHSRIELRGERVYPPDGGKSSVRTFLCVRDGAAAFPPPAGGRMLRIDVPGWEDAAPAELRLGAAGGRIYGAVERNGATNWWAADVAWTNAIPGTAAFQPLPDAPRFFTDAFNDNTNNWTTFKDTTKSSVVITNGCLDIRSTLPGGMTFSTLPRRYDGDFTCKVKARKPDDGMDTAFGIILVSSTNAYMRFSISDDGHWCIVRGSKDGEESMLAPSGGEDEGEVKEFTDDELAEWSENQREFGVELVVERKDGECRFWIVETENGEFKKKREPERGTCMVDGGVYPGLFAMAWEGEAHVAFDGFEMATGTTDEHR